MDENENKVVDARIDAIKLAIHWGISSINLTSVTPTVDDLLGVAKKFKEFILTGEWTPTPVDNTVATVTIQPQAANESQESEASA